MEASPNAVDVPAAMIVAQSTIVRCKTGHKASHLRRIIALDLMKIDPALPAKV